ncbi:MAG: epoxyqueuosine reductase [Ruminococcaceae bacterium]|nr:epoxyqueuosine reductase [Oscillospiraceae bacterium]
MTGMLKIIMAANGINETGVCSFDDVADKLLPCLAKGRIPQDAKSIIVSLFPYKVPVEKGNLSMYAVVPDYHEIAGRMLTAASSALSKAFPGYDFVWFIDNSPIPEVYAAAKSGLGIVGDNGLLINRRYGSYCFIGCIVSTLDIPITKRGEVEYCEHCGACKNACPGCALDNGFSKEKCLSFISQKKGDLTEFEKGLLRQGGMVWGCDICQQVCPHNANAEDTYIQEFLDRVNPNAKPGELETARDRAYMYRGKSVIERNIKILED